jgi:predicted ATPase/class 3 adenylate cyclase
MGALPSGTVTFLFTDIEGSTTLAQKYPDKWESLRERHNDILKSAIESHRGYVFQIIGDAFCASFHTTGDAIRAAAQAQIDLFNEKWGEDPIKVRMGINTGTAQASIDIDHSGGYKGYTSMARVQRLMSAGHGGQVLVSLATEELVREELPDNVTLRDMGEQRLKGLIRPEHIYQLVIPNLPVDYPPLKTMDAYRHNLPIQMTSFIGREQEMEQIVSSISQHRLVTLTGPGGTGKTRLSLQVAADLADQFPNGVWFVELETVESPKYLVPAFARALQFSIDAHSSDLDPKRQLLDYLSKQAMLLVLDNFEHLVEGADLLTDILKVSPKTRLMVTSRERLNLGEEWVYPVSGMRYPHNGNETDAETFSGLALFMERAQQVKPDYILTEANIPAIIRICQLVDGLPLAIELSAAWVSVLSCNEIVAELQANMDFLTSSMRGISDKHRSLRAIFNQTWNRLTDAQQEGFRKLAVFQGGFQRDAANSIAGITLPLLLEFTQKSLLRRNDQGRFEMHPLLKVFAEEKLNEVPEERDAVRQNHQRYYVQFLSDRQNRIQGEKMREIREEVRADLGNVSSAINGAVTDWEEDQAHAALFTFGVYIQTEGFHSAGGSYQRLAQRLREHGAGLEPDAPRRKLLLAVLMGQVFNETTIGNTDSEALLLDCLPALRELKLPYELGMALLSLGIWSEYRSEYTDAIRSLEESLSLLRSFPDHFRTVACLTWLGWAHYGLGEYDRAGEHFQDAYKVCKDHENILGFPYAMSKLGTWADALQKYEKGLEYHQEALKYFEAIGDQAGQGYALSRMSLSAWGMKHYEKAIDVGQAGYEQFHAIGHTWGTATSLCRIGFAEKALGNLDEARASLFEGLELAIENKYSSIANYALIGLADLWSEKGEIEKAVEILTLVIEHASTPRLYQEIAQRIMVGMETRMPPEKFAETQSKARSSGLETFIDEIRRGRIEKAKTAAYELKDL